MPVEIKVPNLGEGIDSADVLEVLVSVGDVIKKDDGIVELETGKATAVVPTTVGGKVVAILIAEGDTVPVGKAILTLEPENAAVADSSESKQPPTQTEKPKEKEVEVEVEEEVQPAASKVEKPSKPAPVPDEQKKTAARQLHDPSLESMESAPQSRLATAGVEPSSIAAGPATRRFAREVGVDLSRVPGSGPGGRITREDILGVVRSGGNGKSVSKTGSGEHDEFGPVHIEKMSRIRRTIAKQMHQSWSTVPRVTNFDDADITDLEAIRQASKADYAARGIKLTSMPFVIKSIAMALRDHPIINASLSDDEQSIVYKEYINIGIAVDTDRGLVVPAMRKAETLSIPEIARQLGLLSEKVRNNEFTVEDLKGGTFTISNLGAIGGTYSTPIVNVPETSIILVGRSRKMPIVKADQIVARLMMPLSISYDHRLVDGAAAARFLNDVIAYLEAPSRLLLAP